MEWEHFDFAVQWEPEDRAVLLRTVRDLLLSQELLAQLECLIYSTGISVSDGGKWEPQLHDETVRHQFVRLLLTFAQYAFATRPFAVSKYWANERFSLYLLQRGLTNKPEMNHTEVAQRAEAVADAQVLLLNSTVIPLCRSTVRVFPALQPCLTALQTNLSMWRSCSSDRGDDLCVSDSQTPNKQDALSGDAATFDVGGFKLVSSDRVERGTVLADTEGFISTQEQIRSLCGENAALQKLIAQLFSEIDMARKRGVEIG
ncbi:unnamed protein product [Trypanosoma congolense IL3000]|uniref:WGS project CAEQ00000000 data, annotated contig 1997 n=1 Tax=Trypanosoma congolense (strain IL3000) TaxID=1068625 RepID=F9WAN6_TRYCI|nr:unnamed protein product [Trypanosoma congolense IL3000]